jgi:hypothetical protein
MAGDIVSPHYDFLRAYFGYKSQVMIKPNTNVDEAVSIKWLMRTLFSGNRELGRI